LQQQEKKLEKLKEEAVRDEETIAIISEDAEQADAEAQMAMWISLCSLLHISAHTCLVDFGSFLGFSSKW